jgi:hypothetical protein
MKSKWRRVDIVLVICVSTYVFQKSEEVVNLMLPNGDKFTDEGIMNFASLTSQ